MKARSRLILAMATAGLAGVLAWVYVLRTQPERKESPGSQVHVEAPTSKMSLLGALPVVEKVAAPVDVNSQLPWSVVVLPQRKRDPDKKISEALKYDPETQALYKRLAETLTGFPAVPFVRIDYFSDENAWPKCRIQAWTGSIDNVQPDPNGGHTVTLTVTPDYKAGITMLHNYKERYSIDADGRVKYLDSPEKLGEARKPSVVIVN